jgi:hypothetical protein
MSDNKEWYFEVTSKEYGIETHGAYDSYQEAVEGMTRVLLMCGRDDVHRVFTKPYVKVHRTVAFSETTRSFVDSVYYGANFNRGAADE